RPTPAPAPAPAPARRIEPAHGHLHFAPATHGPGHPLACPLVDTADCCSTHAASAAGSGKEPTSDDQIRFDHLLEQVWICGEESQPALTSALRVEGPAGQLPVITEEPVTRILARMSDLRLIELNNGDVRLTPAGSQRARDVVRRHRLAERLFK